jgi:nucleoid-associated protein YgaU
MHDHTINASTGSPGNGSTGTSSPSVAPGAEADGLDHAVEALDALDQIAPTRLKRILAPLRTAAGAATRLRGPALAALKAAPAVVDVLGNTAVRIGLASTLSVSTLGGALYWNSQRGTPGVPGAQAAAEKESPQTPHPSPPLQLAGRTATPTAPPEPSQADAAPVLPPPSATVVPEIAAHPTSTAEPDATDLTEPPVVPTPVVQTEAITPPPETDPSAPPALPPSVLTADASTAPELPPPTAPAGTEEVPPTLPPSIATLGGNQPPNEEPRVSLPSSSDAVASQADQPPELPTASTPVVPEAPPASPAPASPPSMALAVPAADAIPNLAATPAPVPPPSPTPAAIPAIEPSSPPVATGDSIPSGFVALPNLGSRSPQAEEPLGEPRSTATRTVTMADVAPLSTTPAPRAATPIADPMESVSHVVQSGENFWTISRLYYGSGRFYKALWKANADQFKTPESLVVGATIRVPPPESLDRAAIDRGPNIEPGFARTAGEVAKTPASATTASAKTASADKKFVDLPRPDPDRAARDRAELVASDDPNDFEGRFHIVAQANETLRSIARDELGNARRADELRDLNLDIVGDRNRLVPGMRLRLPADAGNRTIRR